MGRMAKEADMVGERVKALRESRAWTQAHLAEAAELSLRTVQRLERTHAASAETLLAVAAAFAIDVATLSEPVPAAAPGWLFRAPRPGRAALAGLLLALPAMAFVAVNLLKYGAGVAAPYDIAANAGTALGLGPAFDALSPPILMGGPVAAALIALLALVRPQGEVRGGAVTLTGVELRFHPAAAAILVAAAATVAILLAYLAGETLTHLARSAG
jgi:transcriptional regulator with XRE-family HTH domain